MNLEPIIQSEVSQKEKNKYLILIHIYGTRKMVLMNLFAEQHWRHREQTYGQGQGEAGEGEMNGKSSVGAYTLTYVK